jgi:hypothetical protein
LYFVLGYLPIHVRLCLYITCDPTVVPGGRTVVPGPLFLEERPQGCMTVCERRVRRVQIVAPAAASGENVTENGVQQLVEAMKAEYNPSRLDEPTAHESSEGGSRYKCSVYPECGE